MKRPHQMVMVDDVIAVFRPQDHRDHMPPQELAALVAGHAPPGPAFLRHLAQTDGDLGRPQLGDRNRMQDGFADMHDTTSDDCQIFSEL